jgi:indolepyruvate ferredoxin oxidoreductase beta subunit
VNVLLCGVGGQGTVLASRLIAQCAVDKGSFARTAETIGMAQRGGSVVSHVRYGGAEAIPSPLIQRGEADVLIGFEPGEAVRCLPYLKRGGAAVVSINPVTSAVASIMDQQHPARVFIDYLVKVVPRLILIDGSAIALKAGSLRTLNIALLGAACDVLGFTPEDILAALASRLNPRHIAMNQTALTAGREVSLGGTI